MKIEMVTHGYKASEHFKEVLTTKIDRLNKYFEEDTKIKVACSAQRETQILELTIMVDGFVCRAETSGDNMYNNIDVVLPKLEKQIIKHHEKVISKAKKERTAILQEAEWRKQVKASKLVKTKKFALVAMSPEDAIAQLELVGHSFFVYKDRTTLKTSVVYERKDGDFGVIVVE